MAAHTRPHARADHTRPPHARPKSAPHARPQPLQRARDHRQREQARAPPHLPALAQALGDVGLPETRVVAVEGRRNARGRRRGTVFGIMCPPLVGCRPADERTRVRGGDQHLPGTVLGARPQQPWVRPWPHRGQERLATLWPRVADQRPATRRRWPGTWGGDDRVFTQDGQPLGLGEAWSRGQAPRVRLGIDGRWRGVVIGAGTRVSPVDGTGAGPLPWDLLGPAATSPPDGPGTVGSVDAPGSDRSDRRCGATTITAPRWSRAWKRRSWRAHPCRRLTQLWATAACQVHGADAADGHLVVQLLAGLALRSTARLLGTGRVPMAARVCSLTPHGRCLTATDLE
jgi:hypothetical protein